MNWDSFIPAVLDRTKKVLNSVADRVGKDSTYLMIPAFSVTGLVFNISSVYCLLFPFTIGQRFSLPFPINKPTVNPDFLLCISWIRSGVLYRFKLWENVGEVFECPLYDGRVIESSFTLEVWTLSGSTTCTLSSLYFLKTSLLNVRTQPAISSQVNYLLTGVSNISSPLPATFPLSFTT